ncbi:hypothetical protein GCM10020331_038760 [Ectobacillus funiculus]
MKKFLQRLLAVIRKSVTITERDVAYAVQLGQRGRLQHFEELYEEEIFRNAKGKPIHVKTMGQRQYIHAMKKRMILFFWHWASWDREDVFGSCHGCSSIKKMA